MWRRVTDRRTGSCGTIGGQAPQGNPMMQAAMAPLAGGQQDGAGGLTERLPQLGDQLTPEGQVPQSGLGDIASIMEALGGRRG